MTGSDSLQAEIRSSAACTRSGIAALLVCIFAVSLYPPLSREKAESALGQYFGHRLSIKNLLRTFARRSLLENIEGT